MKMLRMIRLLGCFLLVAIILAPSALAVNKVLSLDGDGDYVEIPNSDILGIRERITVEAWIRWIDDGDDWLALLADGDQGVPWENYRVLINRSGRFVFWMINIDGSVVTPDNSTQPDVWHHIATTYDGAMVIIYVDGLLIFEQELQGEMTPSGLPLRIGHLKDSSHYFNKAVVSNVTFIFENYLKAIASKNGFKNSEIFITEYIKAIASTTPAQSLGPDVNFTGGSLKDLKAISPELSFGELVISGRLTIDQSVTLNVENLMITGSVTSSAEGNPSSFTVEATGGAVLIDGSIDLHGRDGNNDYCFGRDGGDGGNVHLEAAVLNVDQADIRVDGGNRARGSKRSYDGDRGSSGNVTKLIVAMTNPSAFTVNLSVGLNLLSVPLKPEVEMKLSDLSESIGDVSMIIWYNPDEGKVVSYLSTYPVTSPTNTVVEGGKGYIIVMTASKEARFEGAKWDNTVSLSAGLNLLSVPLKPEAEMKLSDLSGYIGDVSTIIWHNPGEGKFVSYLPSHPVTSLNNTVVEGGKGYIVIMTAPKEVTFKGEAWDNAPSVAAPFIASEVSDSTLVLTVEGFVGQSDTIALNGIQVTVKNISNNLSDTDTTGATAGDGQYVTTLIDLSGKQAVRAGDILEVTVVDTSGRFNRTTTRHHITDSEIRAQILSMGKIILSPIPKHTALLQNFPNPFNPETWIPYQLSEESNVVVHIYDIQGHLVRTLSLDRQPAGIYMTKDKAVSWDGRNEAGENVGSGVYFYQLKTNNFSSVRKMVIQK